MVTTSPPSMPANCFMAERLTTQSPKAATGWPSAAAFPRELCSNREYPGEFIGSVLFSRENPEGHEIETFYYFADGRAHGHTYVAPQSSPLSTYSSSTTWLVSSIEQLREWVKLEQLAAGLRQAYRRQHAAAVLQGRQHVPALQRLRDATQLASARADAHAGAPLPGPLSCGGLLA